MFPRPASKVFSSTIKLKGRYIRDIRISTNNSSLLERERERVTLCFIQGVTLQLFLSRQSLISQRATLIYIFYQSFRLRRFIMALFVHSRHQWHDATLETPNWGATSPNWTSWDTNINFNLMPKPQATSHEATSHGHKPQKTTLSLDDRFQWRRPRPPPSTTN